MLFSDFYRCVEVSNCVKCRRRGVKKKKNLLTFQIPSKLVLSCSMSPNSVLKNSSSNISTRRFNYLNRYNYCAEEGRGEERERGKKKDIFPNRTALKTVHFHKRPFPLSLLTLVTKAIKTVATVQPLLSFYYYIYSCKC